MLTGDYQLVLVSGSPRGDCDACPRASGFSRSGSIFQPCARFLARQRAQAGAALEPLVLDGNSSW